MTERDQFKQEIKSLLTSYHEREFQERAYNLMLKLSYALGIIQAEKELTIDVQNLRLVRVGKRVCIWTDGKYYYLLHLLNCKIFCPRNTIEAIEFDFEELENNQELMNNDSDFVRRSDDGELISPDKKRDNDLISPRQEKSLNGRQLLVD